MNFWIKNNYKCFKKYVKNGESDLDRHGTLAEPGGVQVENVNHPLILIGFLLLHFWTKCKSWIYQWGKSRKM